VPPVLAHTGGVESHLLAAGVPLVGSSWVDYVYIPLLSAAVVLVLALVLRWSMPSRSRSRRRGSRVADDLQGLLIGVASTDATEAEWIRARLVAAGVHATSRPAAARTQVLVWPDDVDTALQIVAAERGRRR